MATASYRSEQFGRQTCGQSVSWRRRLCLSGSLQPFGKHSVNFECLFLLLVTDLVLGCIPDQPLGVCEPNIRWSCPVPLVVRNYLNLEKVISTIDRKMSFRANIPNLSMLEDSNARVGCSKINSHRIVLPHFDSLRKDVIIA